MTVTFNETSKAFWTCGTVQNLAKVIVWTADAVSLERCLVAGDSTITLLLLDLKSSGKLGADTALNFRESGALRRYSIQDM